LQKEALKAGGIRTIAMFEALKGILVLVVGFGLLRLLHRNLEATAIHLIHLAHLNPARDYSQIFIEAASRTSDNRLKLLAVVAFLYSTIRFVEAYGLWRKRAWAEWFAIISGSIYLPFEIIELYRRPTPMHAGVLLVNAFIVIYLVYVRWAELKAKTNSGETKASPIDNEPDKVSTS
jgi:uncharacterized membrane protein (DUF2068 family)